MNMNNPLENLRQLTEAVRMAGADIAPTYIEYVQLAFAIANDCGEAGRNDFLSLCSLSSKYDEKNAQALFSNALHADKEDIHLGTVFHLAGQCGVKISGSAGFHKAGTMGTAGTTPDFHTRARDIIRWKMTFPMIPTRRNSSPKAPSLIPPCLPFHRTMCGRSCWRKSSPSVKSPNSVMCCSWERLPYWVPPSPT